MSDTLPPDSINRFSNPRSHMVVAAWLAILSSSSYTMMIFPAAFFYTVCGLSSDKSVVSWNRVSTSRDTDFVKMAEKQGQVNVLRSLFQRIHISALLWCRGSLFEIAWQWGNCVL